MKYIVILGSGVFQVPLIEKARELGFKAVVISNRKDDPGKQIADISLDLSYSDVDLIIEKLRSYQVEAVLSCASEAVIPFENVIKKQLGLANKTQREIEELQNKILLKNSLERAQINCAKCFTVHEAEGQLKKSKKLIAKPIYGSGSSGIRVIDSISELDGIAPENTLIEEYIDGDEFGGDMLLLSRKVSHLTITEKFSNEFLVPIAHLVYPFENETARRVNRYMSLVAERLSLEDGFYNFDLIQNESKDLFLIDIGHRIGGNCIPGLIKYFSGIDEFEILIKHALGIPFEVIASKNEGFYGVHIIGSNKSGKLERLNEWKSTQLLETKFNVKPGQEVKQFDKGGNLLGYAMFKAGSKAQLKATLTEAQNFNWFVLE